jgi:hypothetical protein
VLKSRNLGCEVGSQLGVNIEYVGISRGVWGTSRGGVDNGREDCLRRWRGARQDGGSGALGTRGASRDLRVTKRCLIKVQLYVWGRGCIDGDAGPRLFEPWC